MLFCGLVLSEAAIFKNVNSGLRVHINRQYFLIFYCVYFKNVHIYTDKMTEKLILGDLNAGKFENIDRFISVPFYNI